jgi:hypothetical protein
MIFKFSIKVGTKFGMWQYKEAQTHDKILITKLSHILKKTCTLLGYDYTDRDAIYLLSFSADPVEGYHLRLDRMNKEESDGRGAGRYHNVGESKLSETLRAEGLIPSFVKARYLKEWPERVYLTGC